MSEQFQYDVFLSHSRKDKAKVRRLAERLRDDGLRVWFDESSIPAKIKEGLERSRTLVLVMSKDAFEAEWVTLERHTVLFRDPLNKERRFIPLRLDDSDPPDALRQFAYVDWRKESKQEYAKLLAACRRPAAPEEPEAPESGRRAELVWKEGAHADGITAVAAHPDGERVISGSFDNTIKVWEISTGRCVGTFEDMAWVWSVAAHPDGERVISGSFDNTVKVWEISTGRCVGSLEDHRNWVLSVAAHPDGECVISGSADNTVKVWEISTRRCVGTFEGHTDWVNSVAAHPDGERVISGSRDNTVKVWEISTGRCVGTFEGHTAEVLSVALHPDGERVISGSYDNTVKVWEISSGRCVGTFEGHTAAVWSVAAHPDGERVISGSLDNTVKVWEISTGRCVGTFEGHTAAVVSVAAHLDGERLISGSGDKTVRLWRLSDILGKAAAEADIALYTNAKVLLVGESGAGKTGLTERLAHDTFTPSYATSGVWSTQWRMKGLPLEPGWDREVWLWDFGGQADQRLIHQLYVDNTVLILLVFDADQAAVLPGLREWQQALSRCVPATARTYLVAGRIDVGFRFDREKVRAFAEQHGYRYFETSANDGRGCPELRKAIQTGIPWTQLERRSSPIIYKKLKDEILKLRDEGAVLMTFKELRQVLRQRVAADARFTDADLETVVGLLDGPGVVKELNFGTYILLRPEWINAYAQAVIRTIRAPEDSLGCLPVEDIARGKLIFQSRQASGQVVEEKRLSAREEPIVLQAMEQMLVERQLCLRQEGNLVFPSYCGIEKPIGPLPPKYFVSYTFGGFLDDIYATLVVKLVYCGAFRLKELWRDAADFETLADHRTIGIKLLRDEGGRGTLLVHSDDQVTLQEQVIFAEYIHSHLLEKAAEPQRQRFYICPRCRTPVANREVAMRKLQESGKDAQIICVDCEKYIPLWDALEERFASDEAKKQVALLEEQERITLDARRKGKLLALEVAARITSADQKCFEIPAPEDEGLDIEVEFTEADGSGTGKRVYLQLKAGNSHLQRRRDGTEIFKIKKQSWVKYWLKQDRPVLLVIGTFPEAVDELRRGKEERFADIRWMEISELLRRESKGGTQPVKQIVFKGERLDTMSVRRWRDKALRQALP